MSEEFPSLMTRAKNYLAARKIWVAAGKPLREDEEIKRIYNTHCKNCKYYTNNGYACSQCGCYINDTNGWNKIAWATTHCPLDPPEWQEEAAYRDVDINNDTENMTLENIPKEALPIEPPNAKIVEEVVQDTSVVAVPAPVHAPKKTCGCRK